MAGLVPGSPDRPVLSARNPRLAELRRLSGRRSARAAAGRFVIDGIAYGAKFTYAERQPEGPAYMDWFRDAGFDVREPTHVNEGEGDFLLAGGVFDNDQIDSYIELKMTEVIKFEHTPHPVEYEMYYSA